MTFILFMSVFHQYTSKLPAAKNWMVKLEVFEFPVRGISYNLSFEKPAQAKKRITGKLTKFLKK